jgi:hypothetical protein
MRTCLALATALLTGLAAVAAADEPDSLVIPARERPTATTPT